MALVVGLGNPGPQYERHAAQPGFLAVDRLAERNGDPGHPEGFESACRCGRDRGPGRNAGQAANVHESERGFGQPLMEKQRSSRTRSW